MAADIPLTDSRIKSMFNSFSDLIQGNRHNHKAVRLIDELMVDIMGGLIPGVLFNFSILICIVLPIVISSFFNHHSVGDYIPVAQIGSSPFGGWFWFAAFLTFLILSYIAGHIFFRSDINKADRADIKRRFEQNTEDVGKVLKKSTNRLETINELLQKELKQLTTDETRIEKIFKKTNNSDDDSDDYFDEDLKYLLEHLSTSVNTYIESFTKTVSANLTIESKKGDTRNTEDLQTDAKVIEVPQNAAQITVIPKKATEEEADNSEKCLLTLFSIIFPHKSEKTPKGENPWNVSDSVSVDKYLNIEEKFIYNAFIDIVEKEKIFSKSELRSDLKENYRLNDKTLLACYLILLLQNDSGCSHYEKKFEKHSYFPYLSFYKYLIKRNELRLIRYVDWSPAGARTKNKINRMKMDVQLDYPDAYAIINKNESHIRMASSSWYVSRFAYKLAWWAIGAILLIRVPQSFTIDLSSLTFNISIQGLIKMIGSLNLSELTDHLMGILLPVLPPIIMAILLYNMRKQLIKFIHYQRLREIYYTLYIYHKLEKRNQETEDKGLRFEDALVFSFSRILNDCANRILLCNNDDGH